MTDTITRAPVGNVVRTITLDTADRTVWREDDDLGYLNSGVDWKPGSLPANRVLRAEKLEQGIAAAQSNVTNWPTMTAAQKDAANRFAQRAILNLLREVRDTNSAGGDT
jgi:hypothetical protein